VLYGILNRHGIARAEVTIHEAGAPFRRFEAMRDDKTMAAAMLNPPFAIHARWAGLKDMGAAVAWIGPYLGTVPYVLRAWAHANAATLIAYLAAMIEDFRQAIQTSTPPLSSSSLGLDVVRILAAAQRSLDLDGAKVALSHAGVHSAVLSLRQWYMRMRHGY